MSDTQKLQDTFWMKEAVRLAWEGRYRTSPNPMVGACVVRRNRLAAGGYHAYYGGDHAEIAALKKSGKKSAGSVLYVTMEPCSTWGKTPPCAAAIIRAGIRRVVIGVLDPNPKNHGRGIRVLRDAGLQVTFGVLENEIREQNAYFYKWVREKTPFVTLKMAQSLDGKIADHKKNSRWISGSVARNFVHDLRAEHDAVLVGKNTLLSDNPRLSPLVPARQINPGKPWRVVLDPHFEISLRARIFSGEQLTYVCVSEKRLKRIRPQKTVNLIPVPEVKGRLDLKVLMRRLAGLGVAKLLVEGGGELAWSFLNQGLADKAYWIVAPKIIGGRTAKTSVEGEGFALSRCLEPTVTDIFKIGSDFLFEMNLGSRSYLSK